MGLQLQIIPIGSSLFLVEHNGLWNALSRQGHPDTSPGVSNAGKSGIGFKAPQGRLNLTSKGIGTLTTKVAKDAKSKEEFFLFVRFAIFAVINPLVDSAISNFIISGF
jgi:hypothetical protein